MLGRRVFALMLAVAAGFGTTTAKAQVVLTGAVLFNCDNTGMFGGGFWNTLGGDGAFNLYLTAANSGNGGAFINSGNGAGASIAIPLGAGSHQFSMFGNVGSFNSHDALNLFFGGDNFNPAISVFAEVDFDPPAGFPAFGANSSPFTYALDFTHVPAAGTLSAVVGGTLVVLTDFHWSDPAVLGLDRVSAHDNVLDGTFDSVGSFTLFIAPVPEPHAVFALGLAAVALFGCHRRGKLSLKQKSRNRLV